MSKALLAALLVVGVDAYTVGIVGGGTVGGGIARIMQDKMKALESASGTSLELKAICVRDMSKKRDFELPEGCKLTTNYQDIVGNKDIDLVIEVAGGVTDAKDVVMGAIAGGQDVVTANKALIAAYMPEIKAELAKNPSVQFGFEAAVMGGIPIILSLQNDFVGDQITGMQGIMNGCTNFMLTKMAATGCSYQEVLGEAQALGYAEADPTLDVGGQDARSKLKILLNLAFGAQVPEEDIPCAGITELLPVDFSYAKNMGGTIKLLGNAKLGEDGKLRAFVAPSFVLDTDTLASIGGATNAVDIESENLGSTLLVGQGAGRFPTANSAVNDMVRCAAGSCRGVGGLGRAGSGASVAFDSDYEAAFFMRVTFKNGLGIVSDLGAACAKNGVSIFSMQQLPKLDSFVVLTEKVKTSAVAAVAKELGAKPWAMSVPFWMPCASEPNQSV